MKYSVTRWQIVNSRHIMQRVSYNVFRNHLKILITVILNQLKITKKNPDSYLTNEFIVKRTILKNAVRSQNDIYSVKWSSYSIHYAYIGRWKSVWLVDWLHNLCHKYKILTTNVHFIIKLSTSDCIIIVGFVMWKILPLKMSHYHYFHVCGVKNL